MNIINNNYNNNVSFNAKFLYSDDLQKVVDYALEKGRYKSLDTARRNIDNRKLTTRLLMNIDTYNGKPMVVFSRYEPRRTVAFPKYLYSDYSLRKTVKFISLKDNNPLEFACKMIERLGKEVFHNDMYKTVIADAPVKRELVYAIF